jgi:pyruvate/2-oxoglutarate dehydrogenase complex dihydrolipoamide acyltransferase (E2) component
VIGGLIEIMLPDPGDSTEIEVISVSVAPGDTVTAGTPLMEVATDKANADVEAPADGVIESVGVAEGDIIEPDKVLAILRTSR